MIYKMLNPFGDTEEGHTLERGYAICAEFVDVTRITLKQIEAAEGIEDPAFGNLDLISEHWDHNAAVIVKMEADPQFLLDQKKAQYRPRAQHLLEMAEACLNKQPPPQ